ncbi:MAG: hypothetical protein KatS3mg008_0300 [Acidimicrobiales bacterium]|nr:MAG: hypothetical protein KatS3mg008_0300 [Acidimicrobiales bacterium]
MRRPWNVDPPSERRFVGAAVWCRSTGFTSGPGGVPTGAGSRGSSHREIEGSSLWPAGLWEQWKGAEGTRSFTIVTGPPTEEVKRIHDRMPVAIPPQMWDAWLDPAIDDPADVRRLLEDAQGEPPPVVLRPVDTRVNDPRNDGPELLDEPSEVNVLGVDQP